ncbi:acylphosphatase [Pseudoduganella sp. FT25W]|uniref:acylphosphatase n=1 Tax=Duganella alba TaxID=2666081 RepID=A0A6L5QLE1_9BURK|nr:acylphosphatase [Duganella alba]MRX10475.1 acylphosphatase [Duganella alba]MRX18095.1 acylphosphatase [Duganella alba]
MAKRLVITGLVQGVGYRAAFRRQAEALGLRGWVRNRRDGSVEAEVDGDAAAVEAIIVWARKGPPASRIDGVAVEEAESSADSFSVLPTV